MPDAANLEGFNVETRDIFKNFEPSGNHILESRRNCGKKSIIDSLPRATFKALPFIICFDAKNRNSTTWEIRLSHVPSTDFQEIGAECNRIASSRDRLRKVC